MAQPADITRPRFHLRWSSLACLLFVTAAATGATWAAHRHVERPNIYPACGGVGTLYLNELLGLRPEVGMQPSDSAWDTALMEFCQRAAERARPYIQNPEHNYEVYIRGFYLGRGWPLCTYAPWVRMDIEEAWAKPDPADGPQTSHFDPGLDVRMYFHVLRIDEFGNDPFRPWALAGNWLFYALAAGALWRLGAWGIARFRARRNQRRRGFPVLVGEDAAGA